MFGSVFLVKLGRAEASPFSDTSLQLLSPAIRPKSAHGTGGQPKPQPISEDGNTKDANWPDLGTFGSRLLYENRLIFIKYMKVTRLIALHLRVASF